MNIFESYRKSRSLTGRLEDQVLVEYTWHELVSLGEKTLAIKSLHEITGVSLIEARNMVDDYTKVFEY